MLLALSLPAEMWYWVFLWCLFSSLFVHGAVGLLMLVMLQRHKRGRLITLVLVSVGFLASLSGGVITSKPIYFPFCFLADGLFLERPQSAAFSTQKKTRGDRKAERALGEVTVC